MSASKVRDTAASLDKAMVQIRNSMRGIPIRFAGFKKQHDELARAMADFTVTLVDAGVLVGGGSPRRRRRR